MARRPIAEETGSVRERPDGGGCVVSRRRGVDGPDCLQTLYPRRRQTRLPARAAG